MRPAITRTCVESIRAIYQEPIIVADDSNDVPHDWMDGIPDVHVLRLPYNTGLSYGRNALVGACTSQFFIMMDNDHMIKDPLTVEKLMACQKDCGAAIVCGQLQDFDEDQPRRYYGHFTREGKDIWMNHYAPETIGLVTGLTKPLASYCGCRYGANFFLGVRATFAKFNIHWDPNLRMMEHEDFFLRFPAELRVASVTNVVIDHHLTRKGKDPEYDQFRHNPADRERARAKYFLASEFFKERGGVVHEWKSWRFPQVL